MGAIYPELWSSQLEVTSTGLDIVETASCK
jgi:MFS family permease